MCDIVDRLLGASGDAAGEIQYLRNELANERASSGQVNCELKRMLREAEARIAELEKLAYNNM